MPGRDHRFVGLVDVAGETAPLADLDDLLGLQSTAVAAAISDGSAISERCVSQEQSGDDKLAQTAEMPAGQRDDHLGAGQCERRFIVVELGEKREPVCLGADRVVDVVDAASVAIECLPNAIGEHTGLTGVMRLGEDFILVLDMDRLIPLAAAADLSELSKPDSLGAT